MITPITKIETKEFKGKIVTLLWFDYGNKGQQYTYLNSGVLDYWRKFFKDSEFRFREGMKINIFRVPNTKLYTIKGVEL